MNLFRDSSTNTTPADAAPWDALIIRRAEIDAEVRRLSESPARDDGRRESLVVHPRSSTLARGLAPGIRVTLSVLLPGERTRPRRQNSTEISFCISGGGIAEIGGNEIAFSRYDVWNVPSWTTYRCRNDTDAAQVRLTYSNAALLDQLRAHLVEDEPAEDAPRADEYADEDEPTAASPFGSFQLTPDGAWLMPYELVVSPPNIEARGLHWPWGLVKDKLDQLAALGESYRGRRLYLLYNPATGRTNGTTANFFATMTIRPAKIVDRPHRHMSAAINYYFHGRGHSLVAGNRYDWEAGDLMFSAPGWVVHHHASGPDEQVYELTVQDQPFHLALDSLLWQEDLKKPARLLGTHAGFATNRVSA